MMDLVDRALQNPNFVKWFYKSKVVDANGRPILCYHGANRPDRIGTYFDPKKATSGPMAYFTDSPEIASSYAKKQDTSLHYENDGNQDYDTWFLVKVPRYKNKKSVFSWEFWYSLDHSKRLEISKKAPFVNRDENDNIFLDDDTRGGLNTLDNFNYILKWEAKNNPIVALKRIWLESGAIFNEEIVFLDVLRMVGIENEVDYTNPQSLGGGVIPVFLSISKPLYSDNIGKDVVNALLQASKRTRQGTNRPYGYEGADPWDKKYRHPSVWIDEFIKDVEDPARNFVSFTTIPDWVTKTLKQLGYNGIIDRGGKYSGDHHGVYIPFYPEQIKSAIGNNGNYDPNSRNINEYVTKVPNHKNSKGETAEWVIKDEDNGKVLSSHKTKGQAVSHLKDMKGHASIKEAEYSINRIKRDNHHKYQYQEGVLYQLSNSGTELTLGVDQIEATPENSFYEDQIERYMKYISNGGIIETFPVKQSKIAYNLSNMFEFLDGLNYKDSLDTDADQEIFDDSSFLKDRQYELYEILDEYPSINPKARKTEELFFEGVDLPENKDQLIKDMQLIFDFFNNHSEYTLTDMNHRFEAVKRLGKRTVIAEII